MATGRETAVDSVEGAVCSCGNHLVSSSGYTHPHCTVAIADLAHGTVLPDVRQGL